MRTLGKESRDLVKAGLGLLRDFKMSRKEEENYYEVQNDGMIQQHPFVLGEEKFNDPATRKKEHTIMLIIAAVLIVLHLLTLLGIILSLLGVGGSTSCSENNAVSGQDNSSCLLSDQLNQIVSTLSNMKQTGISTAGVSDDILGIVEEMLQLQNASSILNSVTPVSCQDIKAALPNSPSGYYHVNSRDIYCNMGELCGSGEG